MLGWIKIIVSLIVVLFLTVTIYTFPNGILISHMIGGIFIAFLIISNHEFQSKLTWMLLTIINPFLGIILYFAFGSDSRTRLVYFRKVSSDKLFDKYLTEEKIANPSKNAKIIQNIGKSNLYTGNDVQVLTNGREKFDDLLAEIANAKEYIHMEYYIIRESKIQKQLWDLLIKKANEGLEIKILIDALGSLHLNHKIRNQLKSEGIEIHRYSKVFMPIFNPKVNLRNHRKIVIVDGIYGYLGGINISDEYIEYTKEFGNWRDTHLKIVGPAVTDLQLTFAKDWYFETKENFIRGNEDKYLKKAEVTGTTKVQVTTSGPDDKDLTIKEEYFKLIATAEKSIILMTPYLVPDYELIRALTTTAKNQVDIKMIVPGNPDKKSVGAINRSYYELLLKSGIEIYEMRDTFVHAKVMIIDDDVSVIGSTNLDFRSFNLNFENSAFMVDQELNARMRKIAANDLEKSERIYPNEWKHRAIKTQVMGKIVQLFAPFF